MKRLKITATNQKEVMIRIIFNVSISDSNTVLPIAANIRPSLSNSQRNKYNNFIHRLSTKIEVSEIAYTPPFIQNDPSTSSFESVSTYLTFFLAGIKGGRIYNPGIRLRVSDHADTSDLQDRKSDTNRRIKQYAKDAKDKKYIKHVPKKLLGLFESITVKVEGAEYLPDATFDYTDYDEAIDGIVNTLESLRISYKNNEIFEDDY